MDMESAKGGVGRTFAWLHMSNVVERTSTAHKNEPISAAQKYAGALAPRDTRCP